MLEWVCGARCSTARPNSVANDRDTIFACSTGAPPAAIAIVRISGSAAFGIGRSLTGVLPPPRRAALCALRSPQDGDLLDRALVLVFDASRTATGEDLVELHVHGGRAVVAAVSDAIASQGARLAEPGEFTRRALANGVIDLTAAEGLGDLLSAQTEAQRRAALRMAEGGVRALVDSWATRLVGIAARIEAALDFSDEDDVSGDVDLDVVADLAEVAKEMAVLLAAPPVERLHHGLRVVIAGPPNSGKSTLLNALTGRDVAIVSPISGTTRDRIEAPVSRAGIAYLLTDTAGLTEAPSDAIERIGIDRARQAMDSADMVLWLGDDAPQHRPSIWVHARSDEAGRHALPAGREVGVSAKTGLGMDELWAAITRRAAALLPADDAIAANVRQRGAMADALEHLSRTRSTDLLVVAEGLRGALRALDKVAGKSGVEDILDAIFSQFCIGK